MKSTDSNTNISFDDIIFKRRNKEYGAYNLRKKYNKTLLISFCISVTVAIIATVTPFIAYNIFPSNNDIYLAGYRYVTINTEIFDDLLLPTEEIYIPAAAPAPPPPNFDDINNMLQYTVPEIVDTILPIEEIQLLEDVTVDDNSLEEYNYNTDILYYAENYDFGIGDGSGKGFGDGIGEGAGSPFLIVEIMPSFKNGNIDTFRQWVQQQVIYPYDAIKQKIQGKVIFTFIIETDGTVSNVTIIKSLSPIIDEEVLRVINSSPIWSPGQQDGSPVRVRFSMSLNFVL